MRGVESLFGSLGEVRLAQGRDISRAMLEDVDVLLVRSVTRVDEQLLEGSRLRFVGTATAGVDHIDAACLSDKGIPFYSAPGCNADSVVDYVFSALCQLEGVLEGLLAGGSVGIFGYGEVGRRLSHRLNALAIQHCVYDPWLEQSLPRMSSLEQVLSCDVVSVHASLQHEQPWPSYHMLAAPELARLGQGAVLLNAGRGELIDQPALLALKRSRDDLQLVLDVWEGEPDIDPELMNLCHFVSAHIAGYSFDSKWRATHQLYLALCRELAVVPLQADLKLQLVPVTIPEECSGAALVRFLVEQCYDIREDDRLLREAGPAGFDDLRKNYRWRRELSSLDIVNEAQLDSGQRRTCLALGCRLES